MKNNEMAAKRRKKPSVAEPEPKNLTGGNRANRGGILGREEAQKSQKGKILLGLRDSMLLHSKAAGPQPKANRHKRTQKNTKEGILTADFLDKRGWGTEVADEYEFLSLCSLRSLAAEIFPDLRESKLSRCTTSRIYAPFAVFSRLFLFPAD